MGERQDRQDEDQAAVAVAESPRLSLKVLHALVQVKETEYAQLKETHAELWARRKAATLGRDGYITYLMAEDRM